MVSCFGLRSLKEPFLESSWPRFHAVSGLVQLVLGLGLQKSYQAFDTSRPQTAFWVQYLCHVLIKLTWLTPPVLIVFGVSLLPFFLLYPDVLFLSFAPFLNAPVPSRLRARSFLSLFPLLDPYAPIPFVEVTKFSNFLRLIFAYLLKLVVKLSYFFRLTADRPFIFATRVCPVPFGVAMLLWDEFHLRNAWL